MERYVCIHGHFYQPPRENPWTGSIERQPSAGSDHDWNCRIARECYNPNGAARVVNGEGEIVDLVNNYASLSFNFGPTLLSWYEKEFPAEYRRLLEADRESVRRLGGHGNAIAQAYNHMILPLSNPRDKATQVRWGLADFRSRYGREAESLWLPETACNEDVLKVLIDFGLKYVILAPTQAQKIREIGAEQWVSVENGGIDTRRVYRWSDGPQRSIALFFYDGSISHGIAFEKLPADSAAFAERFEKAFDPGTKESQLITAVTDGESYGHHQSFADMGLAHFFKFQLTKRHLKAVNYGYYLAKHPPTHEVVLKEGAQGMGTAWSCAHGIGRWFEDCGCGAEGLRLDWRRPLRDALDWLREELAKIFEEKADAVLKDAWRARDGYIQVILDRGEDSVASFLKEHLKTEDNPQAREAALTLMEMQRHAMLMYTSCGWFFSDISRIETVQNLKYAARAIQLARDLSGADLEPEFVSRLKRAPSNFPQYGDGWGVYEQLVRPSIVTNDQIAAQYAISVLFDDAPKNQKLYHFEARQESLTRKSAGGADFVLGRAEFYDGITQGRWKRAFLAVALPGQNVRAYVRDARASDEELEALFLCPSLEGKFFTLQDLFHDERARILNLILRKKIEQMEAAGRISLEEHLPLAEKFADLGLEVPSLLKGQVESALAHWISRNGQALQSNFNLGVLETLSAMLRRAKKAGLTVVTAETEAEWQSVVFSRLDVLESRFTTAHLSELSKLIALSEEAGFKFWRARTENRFFQILRGKEISTQAVEICKRLKIHVD